MDGRRFGLLALAAILAATPAAAQTGTDQSLHTYLQRQFSDGATDDPDGRYAAARADLNGDGRDEALVLMLGRRWCGTGGCTMLILTPAGNGWRTVTRTTVTSAPVRLLATRSRGWRDVAVRVAGGGIPAREVILRFNGRGYPGNPSLVAASRGRAAPGRVLISDTDEGRPLYR
jgi:putative lipoprotein